MTAQVPVIVVGAGPVGLSAALRLAAAGVDVLLIEQRDAPADDLRASTFHPPTLEMLDELDLAAPLIGLGLRTRVWQIRQHETHERAEFDLDVIRADTRYPFRLQAEQGSYCVLALERARRHPRVQLEFGTTVTAIEQDDARVRVTVETADGGRATREAGFVVGADGARSRVREALGLEFDGMTYPETTLLATTGFPFHDHLPGLSNVNYVWHDAGTFSLLRLPDIWRCSLYPDDGESVENALRPESIEAKLQRIVSRPEPYTVDAVRPYRIHQRIVRDYRRGRVLLAGDAAHLNSPSGGMGMNGGIHDAFCCADLLAGIVHGQRSPDALDLYTRRRRPVAEEQILRQAHRNRTRMQQRDPEWRRAELARLQAIGANPARAREFLLQSSMITGLRRAEAVT